MSFSNSHVTHVTIVMNLYKETTEGTFLKDVRFKDWMEFLVNVTSML